MSPKVEFPHLFQNVGESQGAQKAQKEQKNCVFFSSFEELPLDLDSVRIAIP